MSNDLLTAGERLVGRRLARERYAGVEHYRSGQHRAEVQPGGDAHLTYVDWMGHAVLVVCAQEDGQWEPLTVTRAGQATVEKVRRAPPFFRLSDKMLAALRDAERRATRL